MSVDQDTTTRDAPSAAAGRRPTWLRPAVVWGAVLGVVILAAVVVVQFSRFPEWDEAVFLSQSGGFQGADARPLKLVASREVGTPVLLGLVRALTSSLVGTRVLWMALALTVLVVALVRLGRVVGFPPAAPVAVLSTYWLSLSFWGSFFSIYLATACMLLATALYLTLRADPRRVVGTGVAVGLAVAACLWLRQVEGALFALALVGHSLVVTPRAFWSRRWRGVAAAAAALVVGFGIPWVVDSVQRFGSVAARLSSGRGQSFERGWDSNLAEYARSLGGWAQTYDRLTSPPSWAVVVLAVLLVAALVATLVAAFSERRSTPPGTDDHGVRLGGVSLLWAVAVTQLAFFMFFIGVIMDRYMVSGALFALVAMIGTVWPRIRAWGDARASGDARPGRWPAVVLTGLFTLWVIANGAIAMAYEDARYVNGKDIQDAAMQIQALADGGPCRGVSRYNTPQLQFGTGCAVRAARTVDVAMAKAAPQQAKGGLRFILWPGSDHEWVAEVLGQRTQSVRLPNRSGPKELVLHWTTAQPTDGDATTP